MSHYEVLGVDKDATPEEIKNAYRDKSKDNHPDKGGDPETQVMINHAYEVLKDPERKEKYDRTGSDKKEDPFIDRFIRTVDQMITEIMSSSKDLDREDFMSMFKQLLRKIKKQIHDMKVSKEREINKFKIVESRFKCKTKNNIIGELLKGKITSLENDLKQLDGEEIFFTRFQEVLEDYDYNFERAQQAQYNIKVNRAAQPQWMADQEEAIKNFYKEE